MQVPVLESPAHPKGEAMSPFTRAQVARQLRWLRQHPMLRAYLAEWRAWGRLLTDGRNLDRTR